MYSIAMSSLSSFLTIFSFIASSTSCCPLLPLATVQSPPKQTRYPDAKFSEVPSHLVSCNPIASQPLAEQGVDVANTVNAVDRYCANVERAKRELVQPRLRPDSLAFHAGGLPHRQPPPSFFRVNALRLSFSFRCLSRFLPYFFRRVGCSTPTTPGLLHCRHFFLLACDL